MRSSDSSATVLMVMAGITEAAQVAVGKAGLTYASRKPAGSGNGPVQW